MGSDGIDVNKELVATVKMHFRRNLLQLVERPRQRRFYFEFQIYLKIKIESEKW